MMMNDPHRIRSSIDQYFADMDAHPSLQSKILAQTRGDVKVKKKLSVGFVVLVVLVLAVVTALAAITLNALYENAIQKEGESGLIQNWSAEDQITLVDWMVDAGIELDADKVAQLQDTSLSEEEKGALAMEIIADYYPARDGILTTIDIIAKDKGPLGTWSLEDKAWYSDMQIKYNNGVTNTKNTLPGESDLSEAAATRIAFDYYQTEYGLTEDYLQSARTENYFQECVIDDQGTIGHRWRLNFYFEGNDWPLSIELSPDGSVVWASAPYERTWRDDWYDTMMEDDFWTIEGLYRFKQEWEPKVKQLQETGELKDSGGDLLYLLSKPFALPRTTDLSRDEALEKANAAILAQNKMTQAILRFFTTREAYRTDDPNRPAYWFVYIWSYDEQVRREASARHYETGDVPYMMIVQIDAATGDTIDLETIWDATTLSLDERLGM